MKLRDNNSNLLNRIGYGALFVIMVVGAIMCGPYGFGLLLAFIITGGTLEFSRMVKLRGYRPHCILGLLSSFILFALNFDYVFVGGNHLPLFEILLVLTIPAIFVAELFSGSKTPIANLGSTLLALIYVAIPTMLLCNVSKLLCGGKWNSLLMVAYFMIIWANDSFAYLVGITLGKNIMFPRISPKKSWEGFFGGVIGSMIFGVLLAHVLGQNLYVWGGMAIIASITGVLGDLIESMFKRSVEIKDSGNIMPGHGGWLDRFDAILLSTPVVYAYLYILNIFELI